MMASETEKEFSSLRMAVLSMAIGYMTSSKATPSLNSLKLSLKHQLRLGSTDKNATAKSARFLENVSKITTALFCD